MKSWEQMVRERLLIISLDPPRSEQEFVHRNSV